MAALPLANWICSPESRAAKESSQACAGESAVPAAVAAALAAGASAASPLIGGGGVNSPATRTAQARRPLQVGQVAVRARATARSPAPAEGSSPERVTSCPEMRSEAQ